MTPIETPSPVSVHEKNAFARVLVPVDGSRTAERGIDCALHLVSRGGAITFCSVVDTTLSYLPAAEGALVDPGQMIAVLDDDAVLFCGQAVSKAAAAGIAADTRLLHGTYADAITAYARTSTYDAIVIGTHARTGLRRAVLGSVAEGLLRGSDVPVLAAHVDDKFRSGPILVAVDNSPASRAALRCAVDLAVSRGKSVALAHIREGAHGDASAANELLEDAAARVRRAGVDVSVVLRDGSPSSQLLDAAEHLESCMIAMGTHGRALFSQLVLGSVAAAVVERARVPVLTVRRAAHH